MENNVYSYLKAFKDLLYKHRHAIPKRKISIDLFFRPDQVFIYNDFYVDYSDIYKKDLLFEDYDKYSSLIFYGTSLSHSLELSFNLIFKSMNEDESMWDGPDFIINHPSVQSRKHFIEDDMELSKFSKHIEETQFSNEIDYYLSCTIIWDDNGNPTFTIDRDESDDEGRAELFEVITYTKEYVDYYNKILNLFTNVPTEYYCKFTETENTTLFKNTAHETLKSIKDSFKDILGFFDDFKKPAVGNIKEDIAFYLTSDPRQVIKEAVLVEHKGANFSLNNYPNKLDGVSSSIIHKYIDNRYVTGLEEERVITRCVVERNKSNLYYVVVEYLKDSLEENLLTQHIANFQLYLTKGKIKEIIEKNGRLFGVSENNEVILVYYMDDLYPPNRLKKFLIKDEALFIQKLNEIISL